MLGLVLFSYCLTDWLCSVKWFSYILPLMCSIVLQIIQYLHSFLILIQHIGNVGKMLVSGYSNQGFKLWLHQYVMSLSKTLYPHCFSWLMWWFQSFHFYLNFYEVWWKNQLRREGTLHPENPLSVNSPTHIVLIASWLYWVCILT